MTKDSLPEVLIDALNNISIDELVNLPENDTVRLGLAFEAFVGKMEAVLTKARNARHLVN